MGFCELALAKALALDWANGGFHPGLTAASRLNRVLLSLRYLDC